LVMRSQPPMRRPAPPQADFYTRVHATGASRGGGGRCRADAHVVDLRARGAGGGSVEDRKSNYADMVNAYYSLATDFYE
jgi:hypothetical protein